MKYILLLTVLFIFPKISLAQNYDLSHFKDRFEIKLNEKGEKVIIDKTLLEDLSINTYIKNFATYLTAQDADVPKEIPSCKGYEYEKPNPELLKSFDKAFEWMRKTNLGKLLVDENFLKFISDVGLEVNKYTSDPQFVVAANLDNSSYFYDTAFIKFLKDRLGDIAEAYFSSTIFLKVVLYIGDDYSSFIANKKAYHQNILSYYLETIPPEELGLTETEKNKALSSIIDSNLSFGGGYWEHRKVKKDFEGYGYKKLLSLDKKSEKRLKKYAEEFDERLNKINHNFSEVSYKGSPLVIDLGTKKERFDDHPSLTFDSVCPEFLYNSRRRFELVRVALGVSPVPYSSALFYLVKSKYQSQSLSEGFYYGYLEATNQTDKKEYILKQSMNPLL